jgi:hypothetical protein
MIVWGLIALAVGLTAYGCRIALTRPNPPYVQGFLDGRLLRERGEERRFRREAAHS